MGIETIILGAISIGMSAMSTAAQNKQLAAQSEAAARQAEAEIRELDRQREFADKKAAGDKAERVRQADRDHASMLVGMADMGGEGSSNEARLASEVGFYEGLDIARIEGNRVRQGESLKASQEFSKTSALNIISANKSQSKSNTYSFLAGAAKTGFSAFSKGPTAPASTSGFSGSGTDFVRANYFDGV